MTKDHIIEMIAATSHEANRAYCRVLAEHHAPWDEAPEWQRESVRQGVRFHLEHPDATPEDSHKNWLRQKQADGWTWGPKKDAEAKTHPCMTDYQNLPLEQRMKDSIFKSIVDALRWMVRE